MPFGNVDFFKGIPRGEYGQSYYTLRSVFMDGVPPPKIHLHLKLFRVETEIPIGDVDVVSEKTPSFTGNEDEVSRVDSAQFENWLLTLWRQKDDLIEHFHQNGNFDSLDNKNSVRIQICLRNIMEAGHSCGFFWFYWVVGLSRKLYRAP